MMAMSLSVGGRMLSIVAITGALLDLPAACGAEELIPFWTLSPGQTFTAQITTSRATRIEIGDYTDESRSDDRLTVDYSLAPSSDHDHLLVQLNPHSIERTTPDRPTSAARNVVAPDALSESANFDLIVDATGQITMAGNVAPSEPAAVAQAEIVRSWFDAPFRVPLRINTVLRPTAPDTTRSEDAESEEDTVISATTSSEHPLRVSLGPLGELNGTTRFSVEDVDRETGEIQFRVGGKLDHVAPPAQSELPLKVTGIVVKPVDIEGHGVLVMNIDDPGLLKSLEMTIQTVVSGTGNVMIDGEPVTISVKQNWGQVCNVGEIRVMGFSQGVPVPIPERSLP